MASFQDILSFLPVSSEKQGQQLWADETKKAYELSQQDENPIRRGLFNLLVDNPDKPNDFGIMNPLVARKTLQAADWLPFLGDVSSVGEGYAMTKGGSPEWGIPLMAMGVLGAGSEVAPWVKTARTKGGIFDLLTPEEQELFKSTTRREDILDYAFKSQKQNELAAMAMAGSPKMGWYAKSGEAIKKVFGEDSERFNALLAALSPQTSVEMNLENALNSWANWTKAGRPTDPIEIKKILGQSVLGGKGEGSVLPAWINNSVRALSTENPNDIVLSGAKVNAFAKALDGDLRQVVLDAWMANASGIDQNILAVDQAIPLPSPSPEYLGITSAIRNVGEDLTRTTGVKFDPSNVQENVWSFAKALLEARQGEGISGRTTRQLLEEGVITPEMIGDVPDFGALLGQDQYGNILRNSGYEEQIAELIANSTGRSTPDLSKFINQDDLLSAADTIEDLYRYRLWTSRTGGFRRSPNLGTSEGSSGIGYQSHSRTDSGVNNVVGSVSGKKSYSATEEFITAGSPAYPNARYPNYVQLNKDNASVDEFIRLSNQNKSSLSPILQSSVDIFDRTGYKGSNLFMTNDGTFGFGIKPDGEIVSVTKLKSSPHIQGSLSALQLATQEGGTWLNAYDTVLPSLYAKSGFKPVARIKWNDDFAPEGWDSSNAVINSFNDGKPDIVFMVYDPTFVGKYSTGLGGRMFEGGDAYEKAVAFAKREADKLKNKPVK